MDFALQTRTSHLNTTKRRAKPVAKLMSTKLALHPRVRERNVDLVRLGPWTR